MARHWWQFWARTRRSPRRRAPARSYEQWLEQQKVQYLRRLQREDPSGYRRYLEELLDDEQQQRRLRSELITRRLESRLEHTGAPRSPASDVMRSIAEGVRVFVDQQRSTTPRAESAPILASASSATPLPQASQTAAPANGHGVNALADRWLVARFRGKSAQQIADWLVTEKRQDIQRIARILATAPDDYRTQLIDSWVEFPQTQAYIREHPQELDQVVTILRERLGITPDLDALQAL